MKLLFGLIGAVLGVWMAALPGAFAGGLLGVIGAFFWEGRGKNADDTPEAADVPVAAPAATALVQRVDALEREVGALRAQVRTLLARAAAMPAPPAADPFAPRAPAAAAIEARAPTPASAALGAPPPTARTGLSAPAPARPPIALTPEPAVTSNLVAAPDLAAASPAPAVAATAPSPLPQGLASPPAAPAWTAPAPRTPAVARRIAPPPPPLRDRLPPFMARFLFGGNTIVKVGVLILFLGLAFLLRYTAERVSVPVEFRYAGVALVGAFLLGLGWRLRARADAAGGSGYGLILQGAGIGVFYLTALAALRLHPLLSPSLAFAFMAAVALLGAVLAVAQDAPWLAFVSVAEGFAAPVLVATGSSAYVPLFSYMAILDVGIFAMAWFKAWRPLNLVGAVATFMLALAWANARYVPADYAGVQAFLVFFFLLFTSIGVLFARRALALGEAPTAAQPLAERAADALRRVGRVDSTLTFGVPLAAFTLQYLLVRDMAWGPAWAASAFALFHIVLGGALMRGRDTRYGLLGEAHVIVGTIFATLAIPLALEGVWTGATWAVEAAGMYWLGARQRREYARAFALLVLAGAAARLMAGLALDLRHDTPLLVGSTLGMGILVIALGAMDAVRRRMPAAENGAVEGINTVLLPFSAAAALATLVWMVLPPMWAGAATAWLAFACAALQARLDAPILRVSSALLHLLALTGLTLSLHPAADAAMLADGWPGLAAAVLVGTALLLTGWLGLREAWHAAADAATPTWSWSGSAGLLAGLAVVCASLLFVMPADRAALVWPWVGVFVLWLGARLRHPALAAAAFALQLAAAAAALAAGPDPWRRFAGEAGVEPAWWAPLVLTLAGFVVGDLLRRAAQSAPGVRRPAWWHSTAMQWTVVAWALLCWSLTLPPELHRDLVLRGTPAAWPNWVNGWLTLTSVAMTVIAGWRQWRVLGQATLATLPLWIWMALAGPVGDGVAPSAALGWFVWPMAFAWHLGLLRLQARWRPVDLTPPAHVAGFWLFVGLATRECIVRTGQLGVQGSAWGTLGAMLVPALVLVLFTRPAVQRRWPVAEQREAYLVAACGPLALLLLGWLWIGNTTSGDAAPLRYLPVLNPLEIGQGIALLSLALWSRALAPALRARAPRPVVTAALGATAFALVTGMVLRTCHHWAGVAWSVDALFASTLTQAALSVVWSLIGVAAMLAGHRGTRRVVWLVGAALLGVVVAKLFLVELADRGSLYRIVSFIVVGALMLVVGYFAPMPPGRGDAQDADGADAPATAPGTR